MRSSPVLAEAVQLVTVLPSPTSMPSSLAVIAPAFSITLLEPA